MTTSDPTAPDAVEMLQRMHACVVLSENHGDVPRVSSDEVLAALWAVQADRARHAEEVAEERRLKELKRQETVSLQGAVRKLMDQLEAEEARVASLRDQLRRAEGERDEALRMVDGLRKSEKTARESMVINMCLRDEAQAENVQLKAERDALRSLLPDVRACAEYCRNILIGPPGMPVEDYPLAPVALAARRILAALESHECPECHMVERCKMSCSRGGSKGARVSVSPREGGE